MERPTLIRALRAVRRRRRLTQRQLAARLGISQSAMSRWERGTAATCTLADVERWAAVLGGRLTMELRVDDGPALTDAQHARLQAWLATLLGSCGWTVVVERSFNHYGERGRIDVLAFHPVARIVLVAEVKSRMVDVQELLGGLDIKRRIAGRMASELGWLDPRATVPMILVREQRRTAGGSAITRSCSTPSRSGAGPPSHGCDGRSAHPRWASCCSPRPDDGGRKEATGSGICVALSGYITIDI